MTEPRYIAIWNAIAADSSNRDLILLGPERTKAALDALVAEVDAAARADERDYWLAQFKVAEDCSEDRPDALEAYDQVIRLMAGGDRD